MFITFTFLTFLAIATAPPNSTDFTIEARGQVFKGDRCDSEWCLFDSTTQLSYAASVSGNTLELSQEDEAISVPIGERVVIAEDLDWTSVNTLQSAEPDIQLQLVRDPTRLVVLRVQGDEKTLFALIEYGGLETPAEPPK